MRNKKISSPVNRSRFTFEGGAAGKRPTNGVASYASERRCCCCCQLGALRATWPYSEGPTRFFFVTSLRFFSFFSVLSFFFLEEEGGRLSKKEKKKKKPRLSFVFLSLSEDKPPTPTEGKF